MRGTLALAAVTVLLAGCTSAPPGYDGSYESRAEETETETVTEFITPPACRRVMRLTRRIDDVWWETTEDYGEFGDLIMEAAEAATYRDGPRLERVIDRYGELGDEESALVDQIVTLSQRRNTAANECLGGN
jgi:hypothetical protein